MAAVAGLAEQSPTFVKSRGLVFESAYARVTVVIVVALRIPVI